MLLFLLIEKKFWVLKSNDLEVEWMNGYDYGG